MKNKIGRNELCFCGSGKKFKQCHGNVGTNVSDQEADIAAAVFDRKRKQVVFVKKSILINQLKKESPRIAESFDQYFFKDISTISEVSADIMGILMLGFRAPDKLNEFQRVCFGPLMNAYDSIISCVELLRTGHRLQPGILIRSIYETLSTVLYLSKRPQDIQKFKQGKLQSQKTISVSTKMLPHLGRTYGFFSKNFAHLGEPHTWLHPLVKYEANDDGARVNLGFIRAVSLLIYMACELIYFDFAVTPRYWRQSREGHLVFEPDDQQSRWMQQFLEESMVQPGGDG